MKKFIGLTFCMLFIAFISTANAQTTTEKKPVGEEIYAVYKKEGIEKAIAKYHALKKKDAAKYQFDEWQLNNLGYRLLREEKNLPAAEKIFALNMAEYPTSSNPHDSYADYLMDAGDKDGALKHYKKSIEIAESKNELSDFEKGVLVNSKSKVAMLENKHKALAFMEGDWKMDVMNYNVPTPRKEHYKASFQYMDGDTYMLNRMTDNDGKIVQVIMMSYNAAKDEYETAFLQPTRLAGFEVSKGKIQKNGNGKYLLQEKFVDASGKEYLLKHHISKENDNKILWLIEESEDNGKNWKKSFDMTYSKGS